MNDLGALPIPTDAATAAWAGPVFALMALTVVVLLIWQAVRYFRSEDSDSDSDSDSGSDSD
mgnify:FL=1